MGAWLGAGLHDFIVSLFHMWTYIATAVASALGAGLTAWHSGFGKGFREGRQAEKKAQARRVYESQVQGGHYELDTPRPPGMRPRPYPPPGQRRRRDHYHD
jgi:hypothetical protein